MACTITKFATPTTKAQLVQFLRLALLAEFPTLAVTIGVGDDGQLDSLSVELDEDGDCDIEFSTTPEGAESFSLPGR